MWYHNFFSAKISIGFCYEITFLNDETAKYRTTLLIKYLFKTDLFFFAEEPSMSRLSKAISHGISAEVPQRKVSWCKRQNMHNLRESSKKYEGSSFSSQQREKASVWGMWLPM